MTIVAPGVAARPVEQPPTTTRQYIRYLWTAASAGMREILLQTAGRPGHIFNLGHGVMPDSDPDVLKRLVDGVHAETGR
jgi:uroporphyrinogen-III decarboxylase